MKNAVWKIIALSLLVTAAFMTAPAYESLVGPTGVLKYDTEKSYGGYTLFSPMINCKTTYLIDMEGNIVHQWDTEYGPGAYAELLPNGNLLRGGTLANPPANFGGAGGIVQEIDWDGNVVWEYKLMTPTEIQHHCFKRIPNGNTLILAWEFKSIEEAIAKGRDPNTIPVSAYAMNQRITGFWVDFVREVNPEGATVWEWHVWDHLGKGPQKFDLNYRLPEPMGGVYPNFDWTHFNVVDYVEDTDQVLLNSRNFSEAYLVNHETGAIEWRWGNKSAYGQGRAPSWYDNGDQKVFGSHNATPLENGNIQIFDNGSERPEGNRSAVIEVNPETNEIVWEYAAKDSTSFFSYRQGSAQRLPNGNVLVTSTQHGHIFEVTPRKQIVWDYVVPIRNGEAVCTIEDGDREHSVNNMVHRAYRYAADYPGLKGKDLSVKGPLAEGCPQFYKVFNVK
ncbi:MAG: aryl-sulfate sulfotransferase [Acidobacteriota bacterium]